MPMNRPKNMQILVDLIVCSGGDGTLDEVVTGIMEAGSNDTDRIYSCRKHRMILPTVFLCLRIWLQSGRDDYEGSRLYHCDIGRFNQQTFAYVAAFGLFTDVSYETDQDLKNVLGHVAYILEGVKQSF